MRIFLKSILFFILIILDYMWAQNTTDQENYELLLLEVQLLKSYNTLSPSGTALIDSAQNYAHEGDYELALIYLGEVRKTFNSSRADEMQNAPFQTEDQKLSFFMYSGVDYNRQEFELGFDKSDSLLVDELSKPFIRFDANYLINSSFSAMNQFKYDREYLLNEFYLSTSQTFMNSGLDVKAGHIFNYNQDYPELGYSEIYMDLKINSLKKNSDWYWSFKNVARLKNYKEASETLPDFFRNSSYLYLLYNIGFFRTIQFDYNLNYNESLKYQNNDFIEQDAGIGYQDNMGDKLKYFIASRYRYSDFNYLVSDQSGDSSFSNISRTVSFNPWLEYHFSDFLNLKIDYNVDFKSFLKKTEQDPDYTYSLINPSFTVIFSNFISWNIGYIYENKRHNLDNLTEKQYAADSDYQSNGFNAGLDYSNLSEMYFSLNFEYTRRRYPNIVAEESISIFSNRNIFSVLFFAQMPLSSRLSVNAIVSYDNDKDIDRDFNDMISSFYTLEFAYTF